MLFQLNLYSCFDDSVCYLLVCWFRFSIHLYDYSSTSICVVNSFPVVYLLVYWFVVLLFDYDIFVLLHLVIGLLDSRYLNVLVCCIFANFLSSFCLYIRALTIPSYYFFSWVCQHHPDRPLLSFLIVNS